MVAGGEWWFVFYDRDFTDATHIQLSALVAGQSPAAGSYGWGRAWSNLGWNVVVAHGDEQLMLDTQIPIEKAIALMSVSRRDRRDEILEARAFATEKGRSLHRIQTATTPILVLRLDPGGKDVARQECVDLPTYNEKDSIRSVVIDFFIRCCGRNHRGQQQRSLRDLRRINWDGG